jgi:long-chain acyl-CoA synthetase
MKYTASDKPAPRGEVCLRGPNIFKGYFKRPEVTAEVFDEHGWFHTGDVGRINPSGTLSIIDRKKNIFKLAQGEYVAPEKIENVYTRAPLVAQCFVYGDSLKSAVVAIVVLDPEVAASWATSSGGMPSTHLRALLTRPELRDAVRTQLSAAAREAGLKGFEQARAFELESEPFSVENNCLTPTFKLKRPQLREKYQSAIGSMYEQLG